MFGDRRQSCCNGALHTFRRVTSVASKHTNTRLITAAQPSRARFDALANRQYGVPTVTNPPVAQARPAAPVRMASLELHERRGGEPFAPNYAITHAALLTAAAAASHPLATHSAWQTVRGSVQIVIALLRAGRSSER